MGTEILIEQGVINENGIVLMSGANSILLISSSTELDHFFNDLKGNWDTVVINSGLAEGFFISVLIYQTFPGYINHLVI